MQKCFTHSKGFIKFPSSSMHVPGFFRRRRLHSLLDVYIDVTVSKSWPQKVGFTGECSQPITRELAAKPISSNTRRLLYSWAASGVKSGCLCKSGPFATGCSYGMTLIATCVANLAAVRFIADKSWAQQASCLPLASCLSSGGFNLFSSRKIGLSLFRG